MQGLWFKHQGPYSFKNSNSLFNDNYWHLSFKNNILTLEVVRLFYHGKVHA